MRCIDYGVDAEDTTLNSNVAIPDKRYINDLDIRVPFSLNYRSRFATELAP